MKYIISLIFMIIMPALISIGQGNDSLPVNNVPRDTAALIKVKENLQSIIPIQQSIMESQKQQIAANRDTLLFLMDKKERLEHSIDSNKTIYVTGVVKKKETFLKKLLHKKQN